MVAEASQDELPISHSCLVAAVDGLQDRAHKNDTDDKEMAEEGEAQVGMQKGVMILTCKEGEDGGKGQEASREMRSSAVLRLAGHAEKSELGAASDDIEDLDLEGQGPAPWPRAHGQLASLVPSESVSSAKRTIVPLKRTIVPLLPHAGPSYHPYQVSPRPLIPFGLQCMHRRALDDPAPALFIHEPACPGRLRCGWRRVKCIQLDNCRPQLTSVFACSKSRQAPWQQVVFENKR